MKIKIITIVVAMLILVIVVSFWLNRTVSTITLDINPSIKINLTMNGKIKNVKALNSDAKEIVKGNFRGKSLDEAIQTITTKIIDNGYVDDGKIVILLYSTGEVSSKEIKNKIQINFEEKNIFPDVVVIENINKEDKKIAKKYNITSAKAAYINLISKENKNIPVETLITKGINELKETKETGNYCDEEYTLEGGLCIKEINRKSASIGMVCPSGYYEYNEKCYEEVAFKENDNLMCSGDFTLKGTKCYRELLIDAEPQYICENGELQGDSCVDKTNGKAPIQRCLTINHTMIDGKCADGPKPTINGGCEYGDYLVNGGCYTIDNEDQWVCPDGGIYHKSQASVPELCPDTLTYIKPIIKGYKCPKDHILKDDKCIKEEIEDARHERFCPDGYTLVNDDADDVDDVDDACINYNNTAQKQSGYTCNERNARLRGDTCILYEMKEAMHI